MTAVWPSWKRWMRRMTSCGGQTWKDTGHQCESQSSVGTQPVVVAVSLVGVEHGCVVSACLDTSPNTAADSWGSAPGQRNSLWGEETSSPVPSFVYFPSHLSPSWFSALRPRRRNCQSKSFSPLGVRERERERKHLAKVKERREKNSKLVIVKTLDDDTVSLREALDCSCGWATGVWRAWVKTIALTIAVETSHTDCLPHATMSGQLWDWPLRKARLPEHDATGWRHRGDISLCNAVQLAVATFGIQVYSANGDTLLAQQGNKAKGNSWSKSAVLVCCF